MGLEGELAPSCQLPNSARLPAQQPIKATGRNYIAAQARSCRGDIWRKQRRRCAATRTAAQLLLSALHTLAALATSGFIVIDLLWEVVFV